ncbi:MAG: LCP family protein [Anaerolineales bacterium]|nr:LCP family protein [Anaerolineales bacterium]
MDKQNNFPFSSRQIFLLGLVLFLGMGVVLSAVVYSTFYDWGLQTDAGEGGKTPAFNASGTPIPQEVELFDITDFEDIPDPESITAPAWDGSRRVTVLVMGVDYRDWQAGFEYSRTDTMMLLTIDPVAKTAGALSIPRDLWAAIPGFNPAKINTAHYFGDLYKYPGGGPALAVKTVENLIGVPIDYYVRLDFYAFVEFIDFINGVEVDVLEPIELEVIGQKYDVVLEPGRYVLDGKLALAYARNRYNEGGDFDRARRQQQIILGIRSRLRNPKIWARMISNAPALYESFTQKITTNIPFDDALKLAGLAVQVEMEDIEMAVIGLEQVNYGRSPDDLSILIPYPDKIRELRDQIFSTGGSFSPAMTGDSLALMQIENANIVIYNGATDGGGIAEKTAAYLRSLGVENVSVQPAGETYSNTKLVDHTGSPYTLRYLANLMNVNLYRIYHNTDIYNSTDVEIWLGTDWQYNNSIP